jgi:glucosylceramidase
MTVFTRRAFVGMAATAAAALPRPSSLWGQGGDRPKTVRAWMTADTQRFSPLSGLEWRNTSTASKQDIQISPDTRYQKVLGFGAAFTDASCYLFDQLNARDRSALMDEFFGPQGLRFSVGRTCIGSSDYSRYAYSYDESPDPDPELKKFSIAHDQEYILPTLRAAVKLNPEMFLFASPWSPPGWMKSGYSLLGGAMRKEYFDAYAQYFVRFLQGYAAEGAKIKAVTIQNEVDTDQNGRMPAALWGQEYEEGFVKGFLGPAIQKASLDTKIWILDHNYDLWGRVLDELSDPEVNKYVDGVAWHGYMGTADSMTRVHKAFPEKHAYWTEGGPDFTLADYATDWSTWSETFTGVLRNWGRCIVGWNYVLDEQGKPNIGPFTCGGMVTVNSKTQKMTRSGQYWAFAHFSKAIQRDASVLASEGEVDGVSHVALENPDGTRVLILTNKKESRQVHCGIGSSVLEVKLPHDSVTTLTW